jgi:translation initiation factor IF-2
MTIQKIRLIKLLSSQIIYKLHEDVDEWEGGKEQEEPDNRIDEDVLSRLGLLIVTCRSRISDTRPDDRTDGKKSAK